MTSHNEKRTKGWTIKYRPWKVVFTEKFETKDEAMKREKQLKSSHGRAYVWEKVQEKYLLNIIENNYLSTVKIRDGTYMDLNIRSGCNKLEKELLAREWFRTKLENQISWLISG